MESEQDRLELRGVCKYFPGVTALQDVDFSVRTGEVHALVGENGAGKSTLMAIAAGSLAADAGSTTLDGVHVAANPDLIRSLGLTIVRQEPALMPDLTVAENLLIGVDPAKRPSPFSANAWAASLLQQWGSDVDIDPRARVNTLIPEQRFIVEIAKALAGEPRILILDEPTEHLILSDVERLFGKIREVCSSGTAVVYISHRIREVQRVADRITVLRDGMTQGTFQADGLTEQEIVDLIVGRSLDTTFPEKTAVSPDAELALDVTDLSGPGFDSVSMKVRKGEIVGLAGIDGNGQREFMRALAGLNESKGRVAVSGAVTSIKNSERAVIGGLVYLPGDRHGEGIVADLSVRENILLRSVGRVATAGYVNDRSEKSVALQAVQDFEVKTPSIETPIGSLSGGNQQKAILAGVLLAEPEVLLADEPTQGVDVGARMEIYSRLHDVADSGRGVLLLSSDALEVAGLSDRVLVFSRGQVVRELEGDDVTEHGITEAVLTSSTTRARAKKSTHNLWYWMDKNYAPPIVITMAVILLGAYAATVNSHYLSTRNFANILELVATLALVAMGQQLLMLTGGIDLSVGPLMGLIVVLGSYYMVDGTASSMQALGWVFIVAAAVAVGLLNWFLTEIVGLHPMISTLASYSGILAVSLILRPTPDGRISASVVDAINARIGFFPVTFIVALLLAVLLEFGLYRSVLGMKLKGLGSRPESARMAGVRPRLVRLGAFVTCSLLTALAGITLMAQIGIGDANSGTSYTLPSVAAVVIGGASLFGGRGGFVGALMGALLLTQVGSVTTFLNLSDAWQYYLLGGMTIFAVAAYSISRRKAVAK